ncbi:serine--tRNA ligase [Candidatus Uhrbacteria bacterium CG10_big_fil_rev_8_21_14_0_10_50_16]|uniref:Serine--tRNA ligase n=1 Tax=Candidatus Uhrbacteria bacterium CG10_big_fil_rev_8_21_14_0_10_50_16 TaxID=1975039 RepID=A0A2H0RNG9_9BACT|nr:MAG: serine--tRNA ligase [Candidatus Uhrbacteria bacterium CG10_big_fil_rev_8_21_14_0_10_50_16]
MDLKFLQEHGDVVEANNARRGARIDISIAQGLISQRVEEMGRVEALRQEGNEIAARIPFAADQDKPTLIEKGKQIRTHVKEQEVQLKEIETALAQELKQYPNILRDDVPDGTDESANELVQTVSEPTTFTFTPKDHLELGEALGIIDVERAAKVSGARFVYLLGDGARMQFALLNYAMDTLVKEQFVPALTPHMIKTEMMDAMGYLSHGGEDEIYHLKNDDLVLIGTSEQSVGPMHSGEILAAEKLPMRYVGYSPCYRREAGSYGKDVRGILRVHQFDKIEMFSYADPENSDQEHEFLLSMQTRLMNGLGLPYRVMKLCAMDTGTPSARTYDIETWMPAQGAYRETHSTSNTTDFQTRRLQTRVKKDGKTQFVHALNGTAFAIGRILIAILENNQQEDGTIKIPEVLRPYMGGQEVITSRL